MHTSHHKLELPNSWGPNAVLPIGPPNDTHISHGVFRTWVVPPIQSHGRHFPKHGYAVAIASVVGSYAVMQRFRLVLLSPEECFPMLFLLTGSIQILQRREEVIGVEIFGCCCCHCHNILWIPHPLISICHAGQFDLSLDEFDTHELST